MSAPQDNPRPLPRAGTLILPPAAEELKLKRRKRSTDAPPPLTRPRAYFALILIVCAVFSPLLLSDILWSDYDSIERTPFKSMDHWQEAWSYDSLQQHDPITLTSYFLEQAIPLPEAAVHRGINILLHLVAAVLFLKNLELLKLPAAFSATLIFALHPVTIQTLFWAGYRNEIIGLILILSALYYGGRNRHARDYITAVVLTLIACLIHPAAIAIPLILALYIIYLERHVHAYSFNRILLLICLCLFLCIWTSNGGGNGSTADTLTATERINHAGQSMAYFSSQALLPLDNALFHRFDTAADYEVGIQMSLLPFLLFIPFYILIAFNIRKRWARGILLGLSSYLLLIIYGIVSDGQFINGEPAHEDRAFYIALPMVIALLITATGRLIYNLGSAGKPIWLIGCALLLIIEITLSASFAYTLAKPTTMWTHMSEQWPDAWEPKAALIASIDDTNPQYTNTELINMLEAILKKRPDLIEQRIRLARLFMAEGHRTNAVREYKRILRESEPDNFFLEEAASIFDKVGLTWEASKTRERKIQTQ